jgi:hypothetical protein
MGLSFTVASAVILGSEFRETHDNILLPQIRNSSNVEGQGLVFVSPRNRVTQFYPHAWRSLFAPRTTLSVTVEVFEPASTGGTCEGLEAVDIYSLGTDRIDNIISMLLYFCGSLPNNEPHY